MFCCGSGGGKRKLGRHVLSKFLISGEIAECARQSELGIVSLCLQQCK